MRARVAYCSRNSTADYLADSVDAFLTEYASAVPSSPSSERGNPFASPSLSEEPAVPLGLTFSFPVEQTALNEGKILTWTKGFAAKNAIGNDVVKLLQDAFDRKHLHVKCVALVNDVSLAHKWYSSISHICRPSEPCCHAHTPEAAVFSVGHPSHSCVAVADRR